MTMKLDDSVIAMWQIEMRLKGDDGVTTDGNWMAILSKQPDGFALNFRYRWYRDDKVGVESQDTRHFYVAKMNPAITDPGEAIKQAREVYEFTRSKTHSSHSWELLRGERSLDAFMELMGTMPGMHMKTISEKEAKEMGLEE